MRYPGIKQLIDANYLRKLSKEDREWYLKFCKEYYYAYFHSAKKQNIHYKMTDRRRLKKELKVRLNDIFIRGKIEK